MITVADDEFIPIRRSGWVYIDPQNQTAAQGDYEVRWYEHTPGKRWFYEIARERFRMGRTEGSAAAAGAAVALANTTWARR